VDVDIDIDTLVIINKEIKALEMSAKKLKDIGTKKDMPIITSNIDRILANINILKHNISDPIDIVYLRKAGQK